MKSLLPVGYTVPVESLPRGRYDVDRELRRDDESACLVPVMLPAVLAPAFRDEKEQNSHFRCGLREVGESNVGAGAAKVVIARSIATTMLVRSFIIVVVGGR